MNLSRLVRSCSEHLRIHGYEACHSSITPDLTDVFSLLKCKVYSLYQTDQKRVHAEKNLLGIIGVVEVGIKGRLDVGNVLAVFVSLVTD